MKLRVNVHPLKGPVDLAPLVDVVFLLLLFFLLSSSFVLQPGVEVRLHGALSGGGSPADRRVLTVTRNGEIYFDDQVVPVAALRERLAPLAAERPGQTVILKADARVEHGVVLAAMDEVLRSGLNVVIASRDTGRAPVAPVAAGEGGP